MTMKRTLGVLAIAGCAAALAPAGAAAAKPAKKPPAAKFLVQVAGTQVTTWKEPKRYIGGDCNGREWTEAGGQETVAFRTKESKVLIRATGALPRIRLGGTGTVDRTGEEVFGLDPGACFDGGETRRTTGPYDCRPIPVDYGVDVDWGTTPAAIATPRIGTLPRYENCPVMAPTEVIPTKFSVVRGQPFKAKSLFGKAKQHTVAGQADFRRDEQFSSAETKVRWTIRFKRVK
jgi:hypothetical protein